MTKTKEIPAEDQLTSVTALLGALLVLIDQPVHIDKEALRSGLPQGGNIVILDNIEDDEYVMYVEVPE